MRSAIRSGAAFIASGPAARQDEFLSSLGEAELRALPFLFEFWALDHQLPPSGDWRSWVILGGRGAGKTRAGAEWVRSVVEGARPTDPGRARRVALVGETVAQARDVMVFGESGILACSPPDRRPEWIAGRKMLVWPNGATAQVFSAHDPESLRGPQFDAAWCDELAKWKKAEAAWDMLQFGLRLGDNPQTCVTTTPRAVPFLKALLGRSSTVMTSAPTEANAANLADGFLKEVRARYDGTSLGAQELDGVLVEEVDGALWPAWVIDRAKVAEAPELSRIVVAVDPPVTGGKRADACGIVVAGVVSGGPKSGWRWVVLADRSVEGASPLGWAKAAVSAFHEFGADRLVAEVNQGGDLVEEMIRQVDPLVPYRAVRASRGKAARAEPVASLYEQGRVAHLPGLKKLEEQMRLMGRDGYQGAGSPDRVDALVWALTELMGAQVGAPRMRVVG
ncbi:DNA-packaging protein [Aestuariibius sp. 2305UL40-4]|uniref:DNA-packaging protein n=1 Tax=Aestuariibius violaceus TaxID=3234132 RepID=UPI00345E8450